MREFCLYFAVVAALASTEVRAAESIAKIELDADNYPTQALPVRSSFTLVKALPGTVRRAAPIFVRFAYRMWNINPSKLPRDYTTGAPIRPDDCVEVARVLHKERFRFKDLSGLPKGRVDVSDLWQAPPFPGARATRIGQEQLLDYKIYRYLDWADSVYVPDVWTRGTPTDSFRVQVDDKTFFRPGAQYCMFFVTEADSAEDRKTAIAKALGETIASHVTSGTETRVEDLVGAVLLAAVADLATEEIEAAVRKAVEDNNGCPKSDLNTMRGCPAYKSALLSTIRERHPLREKQLKSMEDQVNQLATLGTEIARTTVALRGAIGKALLTSPAPASGAWFLDLTDVTGVKCHGDAAKTGGEPAPAPKVTGDDGKAAKEQLRRRQAAELQCLLMTNQKTQVTFHRDAKTGTYVERHLWNHEVVVAVGISANLDDIWIQTAENEATGTKPAAKFKTSDILLSNGKTTLAELLRFHERVLVGSDYMTDETPGPLAEYLEPAALRGGIATDRVKLIALAQAAGLVEAMCKQYADLGSQACQDWMTPMTQGACWPRAGSAKDKEQPIEPHKCIAENASALANLLPEWASAMERLDAKFVEARLDFPAGAVSVEAALRLDQQAWVSSFVTPVVGVAVIGGARAFAIPYAAAQIYFWPNHVDEPMWSNGRLDLRRLVALELGLGITRPNFGPDNRYVQLTDYNTPPFLYGLALQLLPYSTVSIGGALMRVRRSGFEREEPALFHTFYVGFNVELNFFNFVRSRFSKAEFNSARTFALSGPPAP